MPQPVPGHQRRLPKSVRIVQARPRLFICLLAGVVAGLLLPWNWPEVTRLLVAWNIGTFAYIGLVARMMYRATHHNIRQRALVQDEGQLTILVLSIAAALVSLGAIVLQLGAVKELSGLARGLAVLLSVLTIVSAFAFIHIMFTLHYAHDYYMQWLAEADRPAPERGGLNFPGNDHPDYVDFLYFSFVIGVASQTADVATTSRHMRALVLVHGIIAFFFNTTVLALTINIAAGLI